MESKIMISLSKSEASILQSLLEAINPMAQTMSEVEFLKKFLNDLSEVA